MGCSSNKTVQTQQEKHIFPINEKVILGNIFGFKDKEALKAAGVTHVLSLGNKDTPFPEDFKYLNLELIDGLNENPFPKFKEGVEFVEKSGEGKVYIWCPKAISRGPTMTAIYLMFKHHTTRDEALNTIRSIKPDIKPNEHFMAQMLEVEKLIQAGACNA